MLLSYYHDIPIGSSLAVVATVLAGSVVASLLFPKTAEEHTPVPPPEIEGPPDPS
jgi:hypothetical protein